MDQSFKVLPHFFDLKLFLNMHIESWQYYQPEGLSKRRAALVSLRF